LKLAEGNLTKKLKRRVAEYSKVMEERYQKVG